MRGRKEGFRRKMGNEGEERYGGKDEVGNLSTSPELFETKQKHKRKTKNEKRKTKNEKRKTKIEN